MTDPPAPCIRPAVRPFLERTDAKPCSGVIYIGVNMADAALERAERMYRRTRRKRKHVQGERWWRTRKDPFEAVWGQTEQQLERAPDIHATKLLAWLQVRYPDQFEDGQLRTLRRRVKDRRVEQAARQPEPLDDSGTE